ncbi:MAG: hypothetical protein WCS03_13165 [Bacteroidota bacterium]
MNKIQILVVVLVFHYSQFRLLSQEKSCVSVSQETQVLSKGSKSIFKCDIFYNKEKDVVVTHHYYPADFVKMSNRFGEMKIYFPETNSVTIQQNQSLSTTNELLYYFINNKLTDLGLSKEGFKLVSSTPEEGMIVTIWQAPVSLKVINQIKIVFKEMLPVYAEYLGMDKEIKKKIFYSRYADYKTFRMPLRITEISFETKSDSTIRLSIFSNVRTNNFPENNYFNFQIPDDAKISK